MTTYQGGKKKLGKLISQEILKIEEKLVEADFIKCENKSLDYCEPFVGMAGVLVHIVKSKPENTIYANDLNQDIICMWKAIQNGWIPPDACTKEHYLELKNQSIPTAERGFIGSACCFGGVFFNGGFRAIVKLRNYLEEGKRKLLQYKPHLEKVNFSSSSYDDLNFSGKLIYCDPPYKNNKFKTNYFQNFDHKKFWETMRQWSKNNIVIISELEAPSDFICVWTSNYKLLLHSKAIKTNITKNFEEKLFIHESLHKLIY